MDLLEYLASLGIIAVGATTGWVVHRRLGPWIGGLIFTVYSFLALAYQQLYWLQVGAICLGAKIGFFEQAEPLVNRLNASGGIGHPLWDACWDLAPVMLFGLFGYWLCLDAEKTRLRLTGTPSMQDKP